jgi:hypothetical protein
VSSTSIVNDISYRKCVFDSFTELVSSRSFDQDASLVTSLLFNSTSHGWTISNAAVYAKPVENPPPFENLTAVPSISKETIITPLATLADEPATPPLYVTS